MLSISHKSSNLLSQKNEIIVSSYIYKKKIIKKDIIRIKTMEQNHTSNIQIYWYDSRSNTNNNNKNNNNKNNNNKNNNNKNNNEQVVVKLKLNNNKRLSWWCISFLNTRSGYPQSNKNIRNKHQSIKPPFGDLTFCNVQIISKGLEK